MMFEKEAEEATLDLYGSADDVYGKEDYKQGFKAGAEFGYNSAIKWFDAKRSIPLPKRLGIYRYTIEAISDKGDMVCYDYKDKCWKKIVIEDEKVTYVPVEIEMWCNNPLRRCE